MSQQTAEPITDPSQIPDEAGTAPPTQGQAQVDYFGVDETKNVYLPDGKSFVTIQTLTEGDRRKFLNATNKDIRVDRNSGDAHLKVGVGDERYELLRAAIVGWNFVRLHEASGEMRPVPFQKGSNGSILEQWLDKADPKLTGMIELEVRKMNTWLQADLSIEDIDKQISELEELRKTKLDAAEGNVS